ncbi:MAG: amidohydrolase family protein [Lachnospiraceae bacterium]|nr:amidohydrolase family protein [Lachnospiraceae bacterium]
MYEFTDFKKIDMHSHIGTWGNPFNFSGDINLVIDLMDKFNIEKTVLCPSDSSKNMDILEAYKKAKDKIIPVPWQIGLLAERHPKCKFVMLHMGHGHGIYVEAAQTIAKRYKNIWLETSGTSMTAQIFNAYKNVGNDRVMFGLDTPFHAPEVEIQKILSCPLKEKDYENIFYNNAKNFLGALLD